jgi:hypothetical protein
MATKASTTSTTAPVEAAVVEAAVEVVTVKETVRLHTIADLAAVLGITGQQVSAYLKADAHATPVPSFAIYPTYGRRSVELLFTDSDVEAWQLFMATQAEVVQATAAEKAAKALERAAKAQAAADKAVARAAKAQSAIADADQLSLV